MLGKPHNHVGLFDWNDLPPSVSFADIVHTPLKTVLISKAFSTGHKIMTGDAMLLYQGVIAYELLFNEKAPIDIMKKELDAWLQSE